MLHLSQMEFLDALASPSTYPCQSFSQWVIGGFILGNGDNYRVYRACELVFNFWGIGYTVYYTHGGCILAIMTPHSVVTRRPSSMKSRNREAGMCFQIWDLTTTLYFWFGWFWESDWVNFVIYLIFSPIMQSMQVFHMIAILQKKSLRIFGYLYFVF